MKDVAKISWFKRKLIVYIAKYVPTKAIDDSTIGGALNVITECFKDSDEKEILGAVYLLCTKIQEGIDKRFKEFQDKAKDRDQEEVRRRDQRRSLRDRRKH